MTVAITVTSLLLSAVLLSCLIWWLGSRWLRRAHRRQQEESYLHKFRMPHYGDR